MRDACSWAATGASLTTGTTGAGTDYAKNMAGWLREEGFENVQEVRVDLDVGLGARIPRGASRSAKVLGESFTGVLGGRKTMNIDLPSKSSDKHLNLSQRKKNI